MNRIETLISPKMPYRFVHKEAREPEDWENIHAHHGLELLYVHEGKGNIIIDKRLFPVTDNTLVIIQPYQLHKLHMQISDHQPYIRTVMIFEPNALERFFAPFAKLNHWLRKIWKLDFDQQVIYDKADSGLQTLFASMTKRDRPEEEEICLFLLNVMHSLRLILEPVQEQHVSDRQRIAHHTEMIMDFIERHYKQDIKLSLLARELHLSEPYISRIFHKYTGFTVMEYTNAVRMREACLLLVATSLSMKEICAKVGVSSPSYLCQLFQKQFHMSPSQYRAAYHVASGEEDKISKR